MRGLVSRSICLGAVILFVGFIGMSGFANVEATERSLQERVDEPGPVIDTLLDDLFAPGSAKDRAGLMAAAMRGFEVSENALGDMNQDGMVNIWDLLRIRNIHLGIGDPATAYEEEEGDLTRDESIDALDVFEFRRTLLREIGIVHFLDSSGGVVSGAGVSMYFGPGEVDSATTMRIDNWTSGDIEDSTGINFQDLAQDSTFFMKGFKLESSSEGHVYPPKMEITLDTLPPCNLNGSNLLMVARRGPLGNTELIYVSELDISEDSTLLVPSPPYPTISRVDRQFGQSFCRDDHLPNSLMVLYAQNLSRNLTANVVVFEDSEGLSWPMTPISFYPRDVEYDLVEGIVVPIAPIAAGPATAKLIHMGTELASNEMHIDIATLPPTTYSNIDSVIIAFHDSLSVLSSLLISHIDTVSTIPIDIRSFITDGLAIGDELESLNSLVTSPDYPLQAKEYLAGVIEYTGVRDSVLAAITSLSSSPKHVDRSTLGISVGAFLWGISNVGIVISCAATPFTGLSGIACAIGVAGWVGGGYVLIDAVSDKSGVNSDGGIGDRQSTSFVTNGYYGVSASMTKSKADPSYDPKPYPDFCINIWRHNTNARGSVTGQPPDSPGDPNDPDNPNDPNDPNDCPEDCCIDPPPPCPPGAGGLRCESNIHDISRVGITDLPSWANYMISPFKDMIVTPNNGGRQGIVGVVDGAGAFAIPGLTPGDSITFAVYDPHTGHYVGNAGHGIAPNVAEQGLWFDVLLHFEPDTNACIIAIDIADNIPGIVASDCARHEYQLYISEDNSGDTVNFGFWSEEPMTLWIQRPDASFIVRDSSTTYEFMRDVVVDTPGTYKVTVTYGVAGGEGPFEVGICHRSYFPIHHVCQDVTISSGDSLIFEPGVEILFSPGVTITNNGYLHLESLDLYTFAGLILVNNGELDIACDYLEGDLTVINNGTIDFDSTAIEVRQGSVLSCGDSPTVTGNGYPISKITVKLGGTLTHERGILDGLHLVLDTISIELDGSLDVSTKGYRGGYRDDWNTSTGETYPGLQGSTDEAGGSHGGYGGDGYYGVGGSVYDSVDAPHALGSGGGGLNAYGTGANGGGRIRLDIDYLLVDGVISADGGTVHGDRSGGGAGGAVNIHANHIEGTGTIRANGGASIGYCAGGGGGGRIGINLQSGDLSNIDISAKGGLDADCGGFGSSNSPGGAGTIYLYSPEFGNEGKLVIDNRNVSGSTTPLTSDRNTFNSVEVLGRAKYIVGDLDSSLTILDSLLVSGSGTLLSVSDSCGFSVGVLTAESSCSLTVGTGVLLELPQISVLSSANMVTETDLTIADVSNFVLNGGNFDSRNMCTFTIPRFEPDNIASGIFRNWGTLSVLSDSIVINTGVTLEENGLLNALDSVSLMRIYGTLSHSPRSMAISYDDNNDTGLVLHLGDLYIEPGGSINVYGRGYRGRNRDGWSSSRSETYPGFLGASQEAGGSHGGLGGDGFNGDGGETYDSLEAPYAMGAGSGGLSSAIGRNGGGYVSIRVDNMSFNGSINANGENSPGDRIGGAAGGGILIYVRVAGGSGTISANAGNGSWVGGGGGGGRIGILWEEGDVSGWTTSVNGGSGGQYGDPGQAGTVNIENTTKKLTQER